MALCIFSRMAEENSDIAYLTIPKTPTKSHDIFHTVVIF
jgi:hypothetical protein